MFFKFFRRLPRCFRSGRPLGLRVNRKARRTHSSHREYPLGRLPAMSCRAVAFRVRVPAVSRCLKFPGWKARKEFVRTNDLSSESRRSSEIANRRMNHTKYGRTWAAILTGGPGMDSLGSEGFPRVVISCAGVRSWLRFVVAITAGPSVVFFKETHGDTPP